MAQKASNSASTSRTPRSMPARTAAGLARMRWATPRAASAGSPSTSSSREEHAKRVCSSASPLLLPSATLSPALVVTPCSVRMGITPLPLLAPELPALAFELALGLAFMLAFMLASRFVSPARAIRQYEPRGTASMTAASKSDCWGWRTDCWGRTDCWAWGPLPRGVSSIGAIPSSVIASMR